MSSHKKIQPLAIEAEIMRYELNMKVRLEEVDDEGTGEEEMYNMVNEYNRFLKEKIVLLLKHVTNYSL